MLKVKEGDYLLRISFIGFNTESLPLTLSDKMPQKNIGTISLRPDAILLDEAVITAEAPQVTVVEDTLMYNTSAYRVTEGAMLEELIKKIPGAEIDEEGNVKINGKEVKKIMVEGKEYFGGDVKTGLKNIPVDMVDKIKAYDKESDLARITGIEDGDEEMVLDLKVKKGMNKGWFGNADGAIGDKKRYLGRVTLNRFVDKKQISLIGDVNNVNSEGFSNGGGPRWKTNNGLIASKNAGFNFATETSRLETGGSVRYNFKDADIVSKNSTERFLNNNSYCMVHFIYRLNAFGKKGGKGNNYNKKSGNNGNHRDWNNDYR